MVDVVCVLRYPKFFLDNMDRKVTDLASNPRFIMFVAISRLGGARSYAVLGASLCSM